MRKRDLSYVKKSYLITFNLFSGRGNYIWKTKCAENEKRIQSRGHVSVRFHVSTGTQDRQIWSRIWSRPEILSLRSWVSICRPLSDGTYRSFTTRYIKIPIIRMNGSTSMMLLLSRNLLSRLLEKWKRTSNGARKSFRCVMECDAI